jgi:hypothetical protein
MEGMSVFPFRPADEDAVTKLDAKAWEQFMLEHMTGRGSTEISIEEANSFMLQQSEQVRMVQEKKKIGVPSAKRTW